MERLQHTPTALAPDRGESCNNSSTYRFLTEHRHVGNMLSLDLFTQTDQDGWRSIRNPVYPLDDVDKLEEATMPKVDEWVNKKILDGSNNGCTMDNAVVRREWYVC